MSYHMLSYTHSDPLYEALRETLKPQRGTPAQTLKGILEGSADAAMVSLVSYLENRKSLKILPTANIHSMSTTGSTLLVSNGEPMGKKMEIAVTGATRTTSFYLSMILKKMKIEFKLVPTTLQEADLLLAESSHALVIGDEALKVYRSNYRILLDVGFEFSRLYGIMPVYAVTVAALSYDGPIPDEINSAMKSSSNYKAECAAKASQKLGVRPEIMDWYFGLIRYDYSESVQKTVDFVASTM